MEYIIIGLGGALGALSRYGISVWIGSRWDKNFPLATFCVNIAGSFVLGWLYTQFYYGNNFSESIRPFWTTGFLGALTTYSTFAYEIVSLMEKNYKITAVFYLAVSVLTGLGALYAGMLLGRSIL